MIFCGIIKDFDDWHALEDVKQEKKDDISKMCR